MLTTPTHPYTRPAPTRDRLLEAVRILRRHGLAAASAVDAAPHEAYGLLTAALRQRFPDADGACVFWTRQDDQAFGPGGWLDRPLVLHVAGPGAHEATQAALDMVGLEAAPADDGTLLVQAEQVRL